MLGENTCGFVNAIFVVDFAAEKELRFYWQ